jgi:hypothetical protein
MLMNEDVICIRASCQTSYPPPGNLEAPPHAAKMPAMLRRSVEKEGAGDSNRNTLRFTA